MNKRSCEPTANVPERHMESLSLGQYVKLNCKVREPTVFKDDQRFKKILNIEFKEKTFQFPKAASTNREV